jgi:amidophosphoribosyltransferase
MDERSIIAVRDPHGFRPLCLGVLPPKPQDGDAPPAHVVASEPVAFDLIGAELLRDVEPGEMVVIDAGGVRSLRPFDAAPRRMCLFEYVYFARPDATLGGASVYEVRRRCGASLWEEHPVEGMSADDGIVVPVPDSGVPGAIGLAQRARLPFEMGLIRSHYVGRTFIEPSQSNVRIASPPVAWPCFYGIDTPTRSELIASSHSIEEIRRYLTADTLGYLSLDGLIDAVHGVEARASANDLARDSYCHACFSGDYPLPVKPERPHALRLVNA